MLNLSKYCYNEPQYSSPYWLRSADKRCPVFDMGLSVGYIRANTNNQLFDNHLRCAYVTSHGHLYSSCDVCYEFGFEPICRI